MKSRYIVLCLSVVLALALAVPAFGGPTNPVASLTATVKKALKTAKKAQKTATAAKTAAAGALSTANGAQTTAAGAQKEAKAAQGTATTAQKEAKAAQTSANTAKASADAAQATANEAKTAAAAAQVTANSKLGHTSETFGETSASTTADKAALAICPTGEEITGGGYETSGTGSNSVIPVFTGPYGDSWIASLVRINGQAATAWGIRAFAECAGP